MSISIFKYLFYCFYRQLQVINTFKYVKLEIHHLNKDWGTWFILICNLYSHYLQFCKKYTISYAEEQKYISHISAIDVCLAQTFKAKIISLILLENILLVLIMCIVIFNVSRVTLITGHLQKIDRRKPSIT